MPTEAQYQEISDRARDLDSEGHRDQAEAVLRDGLQQARTAGDEAFTYFFEGELFALDEDCAKAFLCYERADERWPDSSVILRNGSQVLSSLNRYEEAIEWSNRALAIAPNDYFTLVSRGVALVNLDRAEEALESYDRALAVKPDDLLLFHNRGTALMHLDRFEEALKSIDRGLQISPAEFNLLRVRAIALGHLGKTEDANEGLRQCLEKEPEDEYSRYWLATFAGLDKAQEIIKELEEQRQKRERERLGAEREARERQIKLDAWRTLSARSAHRIGNQLFASRGALRTLENLEDPEQTEAVTDLLESQNRIRLIVGQFQSFSRNEQPRLRPTPVGPLVIKAARVYASREENIELKIDVPDGLPTCQLDREQIDQALGELLENAIHHTPSGGSIRVAAEAISMPSTQLFRITVDNTGQGVAAEDKDNIFAAFVSKRPGGTGLGLAIVRQIVENHDGVIRETGKPGQNARFEIELPVAADKENGS